MLEHIENSGVHGPVLNRTEPAVLEIFLAVRFESGSRNESDGSRFGSRANFWTFSAQNGENIDF